MMRFLAGCYLTLAVLGAQTAITTSATRTVNVAPDLVDVSLSVIADLSRSQDEVVAALASLGVKAENLTGISTASSVYDPVTRRLLDGVFLNYQFEFLVLVGSWKGIAGQLEAFGKQPPDPLRVVQYNSRLTASDKVVEQARQGLLPDLLVEARKNADALAGAAGFKAGAIQGIGETHYNYGNQVTITITVRYAKV